EWIRPWFGRRRIPIGAFPECASGRRPSAQVFRSGAGWAQGLRCASRCLQILRLKRQPNDASWSKLKAPTRDTSALRARPFPICLRFEAQAGAAEIDFVARTEFFAAAVAARDVDGAALAEDSGAVFAFVVAQA